MREITVWKYNERTGYWDYQRTCHPDTADSWLSIFSRDEPEAEFKLSLKKPKPKKSIFYIPKKSRKAK